MSKRKEPKVKHWTEYNRPDDHPDPAPDLWDVISPHGHIIGPFPTREIAESEMTRRYGDHKASAR